MLTNTRPPDRDHNTRIEPHRQRYSNPHNVNVPHRRSPSGPRFAPPSLLECLPPERVALPRCGSVVHSAAIQDRDGGGKGAIAHKQIVKRTNDMNGFVVLPRRRERTFVRNPTLKGPSPEGAASETSVEYIS
jgi:hypothetical protein